MWLCGVLKVRFDVGFASVLGTHLQKISFGKRLQALPVPEEDGSCKSFSTS